MRRDLVEQQQARACIIEQPGMGQRDRNQHRLLLAGRTFGGGLVFSSHSHGQLVAVRANQRALRRPVAAAARSQRRGQRSRLDRTARLIGERGPREGRLRQQFERLVQPRNYAGAGLCQGGSGLGQLGFQRIEPGGIGFGSFPEQPVPFAQGIVIARCGAGVAGLQRQHQPIQKPPPRARAFGKQPVHCRGQPADAEPFAQLHCRRLGLVDLHDPPPRTLAADARSDLHSPITARKLRAHSKAAIAAMPGHFGQRSPAQASARREQRQRLEHVGLARAVLADQQVEFRRPIDPRIAMIAKVSQQDPVERHGAGAIV